MHGSWVRARSEQSDPHRPSATDSLSREPPSYADCTPPTDADSVLEALAMEKVVGSNPIIRFNKAPLGGVLGSGQRGRNRSLAGDFWPRRQSVYLPFRRSSASIA